MRRAKLRPRICQDARDCAQKFDVGMNIAKAFYSCDDGVRLMKYYLYSVAAYYDVDKANLASAVNKTFFMPDKFAHFQKLAPYKH